MGLKAVAGLNQAAVSITGGNITAVTGVPYVISQSFTAVSTAADTSENIAATISIPANALGTNGAIRLTWRATCTNNANVKTMRVRLGGVGGTVLFTLAITSTAGGAGYLYVANTNSASAQTAWSQWQVNGSTSLAGVNATTAAIDTTSATTLVITFEKATGSDTTTLTGYIAELIRFS